MIRYDFDIDAVTARVRDLDARWLGKAAERTSIFLANKAYGESSSIWSEVKPVFMALQCHKCVYCERQFESEQYGNIEFDLEHFRPKSAVKAWLPSEADEEIGELSELGESSEEGYYWLAYDLRNYAASCKVCNSPLKASFFPIASGRVRDPCDFDELAAEEPLLCYPIGHDDEDPEALIAFVATTAVPVCRTGIKNLRARAVIDFFALNRREQLHKQRAQMIAILGSSLLEKSRGINEAENAEIIGRMTLSTMPHASCLRSFKRSWDEDPSVGEEIYQHCRRLVVGC